MKGFGFASAAALTLTLAGCGGGDYQLGSPHGGGGGLPEVRLAASTGEVVPPGRGAEMAVALRSFVPGSDGWQEVTGARCVVTGGSFYRAVVVTPVRLILPDLGPDAPPLRADCETSTARGSAVVAPAFSWPADRHASGPRRAHWGGGWWYGFQRSGPMSYPDLAVGLR
jgi:hypothetical protein